MSAFRSTRWRGAVSALAALSLFVVLLATASTVAAEPTVELSVSTNSDRSGAQTLDGATLASGTPVAIFVSPVDASAERVDFFYNGHYVKTEYRAPWDLLGTGWGGGAALAHLPDGDAHITAQIHTGNGTVEVSANFTIGAPTPAPPPAPACSTIAEIAVGDANFSTLVTALTVATDAGVVDFLGAVSDPAADLTVFAPTNTAFDALGPALSDVLADPGGALTQVLAYHVLGTSQTGADLAAAGTATTLNGTDITITVSPDGNVFINNAQVVIADIEACNGIVHVIDTVLLPPTPPAPAPPAPVLQDGALVYLVNADNGGYLDADGRRYGYNVETSTQPAADDVWQLEAIGNGNWRIINVEYGRYLDADGYGRHWNVDTSSRAGWGTEWEVTMTASGNYVLRSVDADRYLDADRRNVDTGGTVELDNEWAITLAG